ncbi:MAG: PIN domain-containing protein [Candidatus Bathyarchaeia archaeon]
MAATVYLDTSFLMLSAKFHLDVLSEAESLLQRRIQFVVPSAVLEELRGLAHDRGAPGRDARVALKLVEGVKVRRLPSEGSSDADTILIEAAKLPNTIVATADSTIRKKLRAVDKPVIFLREKAKLELEGIEASYW